MRRVLMRAVVLLSAGASASRLERACRAVGADDACWAVFNATGLEPACDAALGELILGEVPGSRATQELVRR